MLRPSEHQVLVRGVRDLELSVDFGDIRLKLDTGRTPGGRRLITPSNGGQPCPGLWQNALSEPCLCNLARPPVDNAAKQSLGYGTLISI